METFKHKGTTQMSINFSNHT